ncbi:Imm63 family immunity protein [Clostridium tagluense]|uniref:Imm63 family immunity protein n=1 Tax=Clostridium tagluense TaxID=360422 RepID=UPI001C0D15E9|nr:Imm63 family immunity protein [Clostridium tagluense]MBU3130148.1 immunity 63 family protein [Clostridium tagluense]MCB2312986.1 immunity 63 family protein [Clostridium tagluense]MCB2317776.1 immunity 63 family protein [Clostridium tagluense]MCB2322535.1 immunity 63 family protein [Clostridium tagluense]MCB2327559.1 immunity 63 family protein [Clostridium tagluense]
MWRIIRIIHSQNNTHSKINTPIYHLPTFGVNEDYTRPEIRVKKSAYHYVISEKRQEIKHQVTKNLDELLYSTFKYITFEMACDYEVRNRMEGQDFRRLLFNKQLELINLISEEFSLLLKTEIEVILKKYPFKD